MISSLFLFMIYVQIFCIFNLYLSTLWSVINFCVLLNPGGTVDRNPCLCREYHQLPVQEDSTCHRATKPMCHSPRLSLCLELRCHSHVVFPHALEPESRECCNAYALKGVHSMMREVTNEKPGTPQLASAFHSPSREKKHSNKDSSTHLNIKKNNCILLTILILIINVYHFIIRKKYDH